MSAFGPLFDQHFNTPKTKTRATKTQTLKLSNHDVPVQHDQPEWKWRLTPLLCACCVILVVLAGRLWQLQIIDGATNLQASQDNSLTLKTIAAPRGIIYDSKGMIIARNSPSFSLAVTPASLPKSEAQLTTTIKKVAELTHISEKEVKEAITKASATPVIATAIKTNLDRDTELSLLAGKADMPGFSVEEDLTRSYPMGSAFSQLLGYTGSISSDELKQNDFSGYYPGESVGKAGLEKFYESQLHGQLGQRLSQINAQGDLQDRQTEQAPVSGHNVTLSLDGDLQKQVYQSLSEAMSKYHATGAVGVIQNPQNGQVLALVSLPTFDNNLFAQGISSSDYQKLVNDPQQPLFDRAVAGVYPPGSLVKPLLGGEAVASGVITKDTIINSPSYISVGTYRYADWTFWLGRSAPGPINVLQAIAQSCDTFFYQLGGGYESVKGMGVAAIAKYYRQVGFGSLTGIDLPGEVKGTVPDPDWKAEQFPDDPGWYVGNTYQLAIGQSYLLTTPIQINTMTSAIANGGTVLQPQIVTSITDEDGKVLKSYSKQAIKANLMSQTGVSVAQEGMRLAVSKGIVFSFRKNLWPVAAKTGTAEFGTKNSIGQFETHAWVTGYAPADNPKISFTVLLESGGSSTYAAEVANQIVQWYAERHQ